MHLRSRAVPIHVLGQSRQAVLGDGSSLRSLTFVRGRAKANERNTENDGGAGARTCARSRTAKAHSEGLIDAGLRASATSFFRALLNLPSRSLFFHHNSGNIPRLASGRKPMSSPTRRDIQRAGCLKDAGTFGGELAFQICCESRQAALGRQNIAVAGVDVEHEGDERDIERFNAQLERKTPRAREHALEVSSILAHPRETPFAPSLFFRHDPSKTSLHRFSLSAGNWMHGEGLELVRYLLPYSTLKLAGIDAGKGYRWSRRWRRRVLDMAGVALRCRTGAKWECERSFDSSGPERSPRALRLLSQTSTTREAISFTWPLSDTGSKSFERVNGTVLGLEKMLGIESRSNPRVESLRGSLTKLTMRPQAR
ncbi:hypothetical protein C8F04DRAFT_1174506 [Mycena alexandri]|uniref:Uncharacterized protein n=1 Tax=Mycena alexandri TaxID=1745969 RepID=A0AAD6XE92_9AGAR|nr:hypothetical protein C8F04DRAFT_1174506 [Mycena alexandri]